MAIKTLLRSAIRQYGLDVVPYQPGTTTPAKNGPPVRQSRIGVDVENLPNDFNPLTAPIFKAVDDYTMTSPESVNALVEAVRYIVQSQIEGAFVECGVWKGGSAMAMALALKQLGATDRELFLYDTYSGMSAPTQEDVRWDGGTAQDVYNKTQSADKTSAWNYVPLDEVKRNVCSTGYPADRFHFVKGLVEETIPKTVPQKIALLRLDTDFYESTRHELTHLYPRLSTYGVMVIDDYGHWLGARKAVDEYISEHKLRLLLQRVDRTGVRVAIKIP
jgi:O-methyltransferase